MCVLRTGTPKHKNVYEGEYEYEYELFTVIVTSYECSTAVFGKVFGTKSFIEGLLSNLDFKQVFQFDSPQIFQILKKFRKMQTRYKIFQKMTFFLTVFYHMLSNCSF